jgi:hypothetical protein
VEDDIVNAFPAIMKQVFNQLGLRTPFLDRYVEDRDGVFEELSSGSLDRRRIKELFIMCLHGGDCFEKAGAYLHFLHRFVAKFGRPCKCCFETLGLLKSTLCRWQMSRTPWVVLR